MPRQSRSTRSRSRSRRLAAPARSAAVASPPSIDPAAPATMPASTRTTVVRPQASPASLTRGFVTDYNYVIGELKRIVLLTAGIVVLMLVLWLVLV